MLSFAEEIYLLSLDDTTGLPGRQEPWWEGCAATGWRWGPEPMTDGFARPVFADKVVDALVKASVFASAELVPLSFGPWPPRFFYREGSQSPRQPRVV